MDYSAEGTYALKYDSRRIWFFYEWLLETMLPVPDAKKGVVVEVLNPTLQYPGPNRFSKRHRVMNNMPGVNGAILTNNRMQRVKWISA